MVYLKYIMLFIATFLALWLLGYIAYGLYTLSLKPQSPDQKTDAIIVLTGGNGRIETGLTLFAEEHAPQLFITGVHPGVSREKIRSLWHGDKPLPNCCMMIGYNARTTQQNAQETKEWLANKDHKTIRLVTGNFHMPRALYEFHRTIPEIEIIPHAVDQPRFGPLDHMFWRTAFSEYHKLIFRWTVLHLDQYLPDDIVNLQLNPEIEWP
jgi:uncharacterized SAM-binding protein YcdF (DUF218 family)